MTENVTLAQDTQNDIRFPFTMDSERCSSASKIIRVTATVLSFIKRLKRDKFYYKYLTNKELEKAEEMWIKYIQKNTSVMRLWLSLITRKTTL